ncbi:MAG: adenylate/guanylate cyclase domain-containing protein [Micrococcus sp.]|nr:adenylate/guanylate cyclase domain-containing protein [Micrococcus sp.]
MTTPESTPTAPLPVIDPVTGRPTGPASSASRPRSAPAVPPAGWTGAMRTLDAGLVVGPARYTREELAERLGISTESAQAIWRALGYAQLPEGQKVFTVSDAEAFETVVALVDSGTLTETTALSLARSIGQMTDRMVVWQIEALVEDHVAAGVADPDARREVVDLLPDLISPLEKVMRTVYRRQLNNAVKRLTVNVEAGLAASEQGRDGTEDDAWLPLARAVGFADMVSYTTLTRKMDERTLATTVQRFEAKAAEIITAGGGWLVKTIGDEVLFNAETPEAGARIALNLAQEITADPLLPSARVALTWGRVLSRLGDIYGPTVNLASRLTALADPGTVLVDGLTASVLDDDERFVLVPQPPQIVRGFGEVRPSMLMTQSADALDFD